MFWTFSYNIWNLFQFNAVTRVAEQRTRVTLFGVHTIFMRKTRHSESPKNALRVQRPPMTDVSDDVFFFEMWRTYILYTDHCLSLYKFKIYYYKSSPSHNFVPCGCSYNFFERLLRTKQIAVLDIIWYYIKCI